MTALGPSENCHYIRLFLQPIILTVGAGLGACVRIILTTNAPASMFASHSSRLTRVGRRGRRRGRRKSQSRANCGWISIIVSYSGRLYWILSFGCQPRPVARRRVRHPLPSRFLSGSGSSGRSRASRSSSSYRTRLTTERKDSIETVWLWPTKAEAHWWTTFGIAKTN